MTYVRHLFVALLFLFSTSAHSLHRGMVVSEHMLASQVGADILKAGGNAIDAAVAVGYALAVVNPCCGNIGGGGFMTIRLASGKTIFLNFREKAPLKASKNMFLDANGNVIANLSTTGYLAVAVPGTVLGLDTALQRYGSLPRRTVMAPAIKLATEGYRITPFQAAQLQPFTEEFRKQPNIAAIFLPHGQELRAGDHFTQPALARTLTRIANDGPTVFYRGDIAKTIVNASHAHHGILSLADFAKYNVEEYKPIQCHYREYTILSAPPPSSGGVTLCEILQILEPLPIKKSGFLSATTIHYLVEAMGVGFVDRNNQLGDPNFVHNPIDKLLSPAYTQKISERILKNPNASSQATINPQHELTDTTHYSIVDRQGNAVAVTYTLNGFFGARVIAGDTGFFLNDEMDDFTAKPGTDNKFGLMQSNTNSIAPGKRPLSSMTPTIVLKNGKLFAVIGSPGGPRIITSVLLTLINLIDFHLPLPTAINSPRLHYQQTPSTVDVEPLTLSPATRNALIALQYQLREQRTWGAVEAILIDADKGEVQGANDYRRPDGAAIAN